MYSTPQNRWRSAKKGKLTNLKIQGHAFIMASYSIRRENQKFQKDHGSQFDHSFGKKCLKSISF